MRTHHRPLLATLLLSGLALTSCGEGSKDASQAICDLIFDCDCEQTKYADVAACVAEYDARAEDEREKAKMLAEANGLTFDQACDDKYRQVSGDLGCELDDAPASGCSYCARAHGDKAKGDACTDYEGYSDCAGDLLCADGRCVDPCESYPVGAACSGEPGEDRCDAGLYCSAASTCQPLPGQDAACTNFGLCAGGLYCDPATVTCEPLPGDGEPCSIFCAEDLQCDAGTCKPGPAEGEPCATAGVCGAGTTCDFNTSTCVAEQADICLFM